MTKEETVQKLNDSKLLPVATADDFNTLPKGVSVEELNTYLKNYLKPQENCWLCDKSLMINWHPIAHGESVCVKCDIGSRTYHYFETSEGRVRWEMTLQYHPSNFSVQE